MKTRSPQSPFKFSRRKTLALSLAALLPLPRTTRAADEPAPLDEWPEFRGPTGQGLSTAKNIPTKWSATENIAWRTPLPGQGWSSPSLSRGKLYLTTAANIQKNVTLSAAAVDAATGKILWGTDIFKPDPAAAAQMHRKNTLASPTPVVHGDRVFAHFGHLGTAALDTAGKILWRQTDFAYAPTHGNGSSPILYKDSVIFSADAQSNPFLIALDQQTGKKVWSVPRTGGVARNKFSFCTPLIIEVAGVKQLISPASGYVAAYSPDDGKEIWRSQYGQGYSVVPRPVYAHGLLFICSGFDRANLFAIKVEGASGDVTEKNLAWKATKAAPLTPSPIVVGDEIYTVADNGIATCADAKTGKEHWTHRLEGNHSASPVHAEGKIYFQNESGIAYVIKAATKFELLAENDVKERTLASYALAEGAIYLRTESQLLKIKA